MRPDRTVHFLVILSALLVLLSAAAPAGANGYWNVPSTVFQCMGIGWGAGYHAPLVLGPINCKEWCNHNEVRLPYSPSSCCCYGARDWNTAYPSRLESPVLPPQPQPQPTAAAPGNGVFAPPIER